MRGNELQLKARGLAIAMEKIDLDLAEAKRADAVEDKLSESTVETNITVRKTYFCFESHTKTTAKSSFCCFAW